MRCLRRGCLPTSGRSRGIAVQSSLMMLLPRDMARIGYLYLQGGEWAGKHLPLSYVDDAVYHATVDTHSSFDPGLRYSQLFWAFLNKHSRRDDFTSARKPRLPSRGSLATT
jgi:CubicO group peptidase (beta-lactamase class C family)